MPVVSHWIGDRREVYGTLGRVRGARRVLESVREHQGPGMRFPARAVGQARARAPRAEGLVGGQRHGLEHGTPGLRVATRSSAQRGAWKRQGVAVQHLAPSTRTPCAGRLRPAPRPQLGHRHIDQSLLGQPVEARHLAPAAPKSSVGLSRSSRAPCRESAPAMGAQLAHGKPSQREQQTHHPDPHPQR